MLLNILLILSSFIKIVKTMVNRDKVNLQDAKSCYCVPAYWHIWILTQYPGVKNPNQLNLYRKTNLLPVLSTWLHMNTRTQAELKALSPLLLYAAATCWKECRDFSYSWKIRKLLIIFQYECVYKMKNHLAIDDSKVSGNIILKL